MQERYKANGMGLERLFRAWRCSWQGFDYIYRNEAAFRQELLLCLVALPAGWLLADSGTERALLCGSILVILLVEVLNSAIECVVDRIGPEIHPLSGAAKDLGSTAVLLAMLLAAFTWGSVLLT